VGASTLLKTCPLTTDIYNELSCATEALYLFVVDKLRAAGCVYAEEEARLLVSSVPMVDLHNSVEQRVSGTPLEYVLGWADFLGHRIALDESVFIPRRRSEFLASQAIDLLEAGGVLLDLCCGSGALAVVIAASFAADEPVTVWASDIDPIAARCARKNLASVGGQVVEGDLYEALPAELKGWVHVIVSNAPYVPIEEIEFLPREARLYEPHRAFAGGSDGLSEQRRVAEQAPAWLAPGGTLLMETSEAAAHRTKAIFEASGLVARVVRSESWDATVVIGTRADGDGAS
jgi:release factor glutamine methyltransferase